MRRARLAVAAATMTAAMTTCPPAGAVDLPPSGTIDMPARSSVLEVLGEPWLTLERLCAT